MTFGAIVDNDMTSRVQRIRCQHIATASAAATAVARGRIGSLIAAYCLVRPRSCEKHCCAIVGTRHSATLFPTECHISSTHCPAVAEVAEAGTHYEVCSCVSCVSSPDGTGIRRRFPDRSIITARLHLCAKERCSY